MWLCLGPFFKSLENTFIALDNVMLVNIVGLELSGRDGHTEADFEDFTALRTFKNCQSKLSLRLKQQYRQACACMGSPIAP